MAVIEGILVLGDEGDYGDFLLTMALDTFFGGLALQIKRAFDWLRASGLSDAAGKKARKQGKELSGAYFKRIGEKAATDLVIDQVVGEMNNATKSAFGVGERRP